jgi:hypothetical protein
MSGLHVLHLIAAAIDVSIYQEKPGVSALVEKLLSSSRPTELVVLPAMCLTETWPRAIAIFVSAL